MIQRFLRRLAWAAVLLAVQVLVLDYIHPWGYGAPMVMPLLVITLPRGTGRAEALLWGFLAGLAADLFAGTTGMGAAAMTLIAFLQPPLLELMAGREEEEDFTPSVASMGRWGFTRLSALLLLVHHVCYFALEGFSRFLLRDITVSMAVSYAMSLAVLLLFAIAKRSDER